VKNKGGMNIEREDHVRDASWVLTKLIGCKVRKILIRAILRKGECTTDIRNGGEKKLRSYFKEVAHQTRLMAMRGIIRGD